MDKMQQFSVKRKIETSVKIITKTYDLIHIENFLNTLISVRKLQGYSIQINNNRILVYNDTYSAEYWINNAKVFTSPADKLIVSN